MSLQTKASPDDAIPIDPALTRVKVEKWHNGQGLSCDDEVATETPVALEYNGIAHAVMLASPADLEDFALGFSLSEGILSEPSQLFDCEVSATSNGIQVAMQISSQQFAGLKERRRNLTGRTGCGLCGTESLGEAIRYSPPVQSAARFSAEMIRAGMASMQAQQPLQQHSGATHAAAWLTADGTVAVVREDVGRHNALDKLIGALARGKQDFSAGAVLITSRASVEMVQKAATVGIGFVAAISAPTNLAIDMARRSNVTLVGFVRDRSHVVYANPRRLIEEKE